MAKITSKRKKRRPLIEMKEPLPEKSFYEGETFDIVLHAWMSRFIGWLSPASFNLALFDWLIHLLISPAKQADISRNAAQKLVKFNLYAAQDLLNTDKSCATHITDKRFKNELWEVFPFNLYTQGFLLTQQWLNEATSNLRGVSVHNQRVVNFTTRQLLDMFSPSNFYWTNPEVLQATFCQAGTNLLNGFNNLFEDVFRYVNALPPAGTDEFKVGVNLAVTEGKVIYRNHLMELIQYEPTTSKVYPEPILIIPAWIMKYYILDLSQHNSLVKYLVDHGHTVFMISWRNPDSSDRNLGLDDYLKLGVLDALEAVGNIIPKRKIHAVGYCIGGTLLMIAAAAMASKSDNRLQTITLFAAQVDFKEAGEILLFVDESQISYLEDIMWERGYLDGQQMAGAFSMLHSNDLIWSRMIRDYLMGKRRPINDLMAWDLDTTRLPFRMHSEYLHDLFLNNDLVQGHFKVNKKKIALIDVNSPLFAVSTLTDHVSPWKSAYKIHLFTDTDVTFVLTTGGHNAGIVSEPGHKGRKYQMATHKRGDKYITSEHWRESATEYKGSWWPAWQKWLVSYSGEKIKSPTMGNDDKGYPVLCNAPGTYVFQR
jgi:polyhydroxyalkanoate synthase subunit PhaC